ncbi:membrane protein [Pseudonocardia ailaonensis]|uniref:Membrane protein n=1 Tax=Pseudonocardia ailaonensis TaxID=367279 RepID=A0ABN2NGC3_9PSEU
MDEHRDWVELRVHGVHATPPESMLNIDRVQQVAGDQLGRFFRPADRRGAVLPAGDGQILEGYHWGRLTSGSGAQGLWLLLAPFGLVNAAQFMLPRPHDRIGRAAHTVAGAMLRLVGLGLTALFVYTTAVMTVDLWAWQRAGGERGFTFAVALAAPIALTFLFRWLARARPETIAEDRPPPATPEGRYVTELTRPGFFEGDPDAPALRLLHVATGFAVVAVAGAILADVHWSFVVVAVVLLGVVATGTVVMGDPEGSAQVDADGTGFDPGGRSGVRTIAFWSAVVCGAAAGAALVLAWAAPPAHPVGMPHAPGIDILGAWLVIAVAVGAFLLAVANDVLARRPDPSAPSTGSAPEADRADRAAEARHRAASAAFRPYAGGRACTLVALLAIFVGIGYSGSFTVFVARVLDPAGSTVTVPDLMARVVYAWGITAFVVLALVGYVLVQRSRSRRTLVDRVSEDFGPGREIPGPWLARVAGAVWAARLKNHLVCVLTLFAVVGVVLTAAVVVAIGPVLVGGVPATPPLPLSLLTASGGPTPHPAEVFFTSVGTITLLLLATGLVSLGRTAILGESRRRAVNVIWDVISFWPRSAHPFVPAIYSQRAVADIENRIRRHVGRPGRSVALCGHSQGSLLCFAALLRLGARDEDKGLLSRVVFLSFGSQLQVMFSRAFPAYVNLGAIEALYATLGKRWRNLYRDTDPLAGPVLSWDHHDRAAHWIDGGPDGDVVTGARQQFGPDWRLLDPPPPPDPTLQGGPLIALRGHGDYWLDAAWYAALGDLLPGHPVDPGAAPQLAPTTPAADDETLPRLGPDPALPVASAHEQVARS